MKSFSQLKEKFDIFSSRSADTFVEIRGRNLLVAEGYCRIGEYSEKSLVLASDVHTVSVRGESLRLRHLSNERIAVEGRIDSFEFI